MHFEDAEREIRIRGMVGPSKWQNQDLKGDPLLVEYRSR